MPAKRKQSTEQVGGAKRQKADRDSGYRSTGNGTKYKETTSVDKHGEHEADFLMHDVSFQAKPDGYDGDNDSGRKGQSTRPTQPIFLQTVATSGPGSNVATYDTKCKY